MIGRSLIIFQRGGDQNELHQVGAMDLAFSPHKDEETMNKAIVKQAK